MTGLHLQRPRLHSHCRKGLSNYRHTCKGIWIGLEYSDGPNSKGRLSYLSANDSRGQGYDGGSMYYAFASQNVKTMVSMQEENIPADPAIDLSRSNSLYQDGLNEVRVNALFGLHLIRAYQWESKEACGLNCTWASVNGVSSGKIKKRMVVTLIIWCNCHVNFVCSWIDLENACRFRRKDSVLSVDNSQSAWAIRSRNTWAPQLAPWGSLPKCLAYYQQNQRDEQFKQPSFATLCYTRGMRFKPKHDLIL